MEKSRRLISLLSMDAIIARYSSPSRCRHSDWFSPSPRPHPQPAPSIWSDGWGCSFFSVYLLTALLLVTYVYCPCFANVNFKGISNRDTFLFQNFILLQRFKLIIKNMKIKNHFLCMMAIASPLVSCNSHPKFQTSVDVVEGCKQELVALKGKMKMSMNQFRRPPWRYVLVYMILSRRKKYFHWRQSFLLFSSWQMEGFWLKQNAYLLLWVQESFSQSSLDMGRMVRKYLSSTHWGNCESKKRFSERLLSFRYSLMIELV